MTTPSAFEGTELSLIICAPLVKGGTYLYDITADVNNYTHAIAADGGYISSSFTINGNREFVEDWLQSGLGRHVQTKNPSGNIIWEGFVNQIDINDGNVTFTRGPLVDIGNYIFVIYNQISEDETNNEGEPVTYGKTLTLAVEDEDSQELYGLREKLVSVGDMYKNEAEALRDLYLEDNAYPNSTLSIALGDDSKSVSVTLQCRGYIDWLDFTYNYGTEPGTTINADVKIKAILATDPNNVFSTDYSYIEYTGAIIGEFEGDYRTSKTIIDEIVSLGGISSERCMFGVYANQKCHYKVIPTEVEYNYYVADQLQMVENAKGGIVKPWDVSAGKWIRLPDYLVAGKYLTTTENLHKDPRAFFLEQIDYTAPFSLTLNGSKVRRITQLLAILGLGGA